jgi:hypothetical protein
VNNLENDIILFSREIGNLSQKKFLRRGMCRRNSSPLTKRKLFSFNILDGFGGCYKRSADDFLSSLQRSNLKGGSLWRGN